MHNSQSSSCSFFTLFIATILCALGLTPTTFAEGTRSWEQSKFDELNKGTATGVAIRSVGGLELAPTFKSLFASPSTYIWAIAADDAGVVYLAAGAPARVYRVPPQGEPTIIFEPKELQVQALQIGAGGVIYAATAPDGKVYKVEHKAGVNADFNKRGSGRGTDSEGLEKESTKIRLDPSWSSSVYFEPGTKYIWDVALDKNGNLFVATGDHGEIFRVTAKGEHSVFFKSDETHIRVLAFDGAGNLIAGSDGSGLIYRISPAGESFVLYGAPKKEITALAIDRSGNIYAAGVGERKTSAGAGVTTVPVTTMSTSATVATGPQLPGITINPPTGVAVMAGPFPFPGGGAAGGADIYRIAADGSPTRVWSSHEDIVYALALDTNGRLLAGTGNRGHIFALDGVDNYSDLLKSSASQVTAFAKAPGGGVYAATSNLGKLFLLGPGPEKEGTYLSDVFDAKIFSRWGKVDFRGGGGVDLFTRSGNVDNPDRGWSPWRKIDLGKQQEASAPAARYAQWKAVLHAGAAAPGVDSVMLSYLPKNVSPEIDEVIVQVGVKYQAATKSSNSFGTDFPSSISGSHFDSAPTSTHDRDSIGVKWNAHDENEDQLTYSLYYRGDQEKRWLLLKDGIADKAYSFDASLLPDGGYTVKVVASDAPSHSPGDGLTTERESRRFEVDTTPPRVEELSATAEGSGIHVKFRAVDGFSPIKRAEYSIDAGDWQYVDPVGQLSDAKSESYDFNAVASAKENRLALAHVVVVRVYDRYDNMGAAKILINSK